MAAKVKPKPRRKQIPAKVKDHVRIGDYSDLELLEIMADLGGDKHDVASEDLAKRLFGRIVHNQPVYLAYAKQCVGSRMGWMSRFQLIDKGDQKSSWRLSEVGNELRKHRLGSNLTRSVIDSDETSVLHLAQAVGERIQTTGDVAFKAMERQLRFNVLRRKYR